MILDFCVDPSSDPKSLMVNLKNTQRHLWPCWRAIAYARGYGEVTEGIFMIPDKQGYQSGERHEKKAESQKYFFFSKSLKFHSLAQIQKGKKGAQKTGS